jgi:hypothetical protein
MPIAGDVASRHQVVDLQRKEQHARVVGKAVRDRRMSLITNELRRI